MIITDYAIIKLERDDKRQWTIIGQSNDIPGDTRPYEIWPIVAMIKVTYDERGYEQSELVKIPRTRAQGFIDPSEQFAYVQWMFWKRSSDEQVQAMDAIRIQINRQPRVPEGGE